MSSFVERYFSSPDASERYGRLQFDEPLAKHNSWKIGGPADLLVEPETVEQVAAVLALANTEEIPLVVIGQGTNLLFDDAGVRGIVLKIGAAMGTIVIDGQRIVAGAGAWVPQLARLSMRAGLTGLEHTIGIPGTVGGLVMMNGGSQRKGIGENVVRVTVVEADGSIRQLSREDCAFSYRHSALQGSGCVVVEAELECPQADVAEVRQNMLDDLRTRRQKFPRKMPNCGSVFLSTAEMHASVGPPGKIIEEAGLKGVQIGKAQVSPQHANFIVNLGGACSADVLRLIAEVRKTVYQRIGFELKCEVRYVSPKGKLMPAHLKAEQENPSATNNAPN
ncbi:UDP-N-acetylmuramate dehydrogenase [Malonomonas rubra DSM 5091]|uniref:UDP-N-acetylenolpyruvoylglucosamine reductase n=1 Tax=Malonomonas rubra DSM 5091 TaxID=1122189 RepID=A0A1M6CE04_MALRU|nr:UDP-N-acetylmuramate dehydrogenase [Malonomonas rubra]SHI58928.1 UDP-N-acetylmuramate dehydrogenase [Malonomonas rubra DSM 5091]